MTMNGKLLKATGTEYKQNVDGGFGKGLAKNQRKRAMEKLEKRIQAVMFKKYLDRNPAAAAMKGYKGKIKCTLTFSAYMSARTPTRSLTILSLLLLIASASLIP